MYQEDFLCKDDIKTICKSSKVDDLLEMQILDLVKEISAIQPDLQSRLK